MYLLRKPSLGAPEFQLVTAQYNVITLFRVEGAHAALKEINSMPHHSTLTELQPTRARGQKMGLGLE